MSGAVAQANALRWLPSRAEPEFKRGNERDENTTDEPECPSPLDDDTTIKPFKVLLLHCKTWLFLSF